MKKKVKDCTLTELEEYFIKKFNIKPTHIDAYIYDVRFFTIEEDVIRSEHPKHWLWKDAEIEVSDNA